MSGGVVGARMGGEGGGGLGLGLGLGLSNVVGSVRGWG